RLEAAPGAAPAIGETHVYVPASNGSLMVLAIDPEESLPLRVASPGELMVRPVVTDNRVVWSTMAGDVYSVPLDGRGESVRVEDAGVVAGPALAVGERIMLVSRVGELVAKQAKNGRRVWRGSLGERAAGSGAMVDGVAYVPARGGSMHAVDFETGREQWVAPGVAAVVAVSGEQVYAIDSRGSLVLLDRADGRLLGAVPGVTGLTAVTNPIDDRVYLVSSDGLIQSLHEATLSEPRRHDGAVAEGPAEDPAEDSPEAVDAPAAPVDDEPSPFDEEPAEESPLDDPFGDPAAADDAGDDPFGDDPFADF
ncbi:MAG: PQQ-binding-like beta-propeller repeat protein, partial [Planctomycetota bacterium]